MGTSREVALQEIALLEQKKDLQEGLPYLYAWKHYKWSREFFESRNRHNFLCAANQIGKSSAMIRRCIHHATCKELWPILWKTRPLTFFYCYPSLKVATLEFLQKWVPEFLPRGKWKDHPYYGWRAEFKNKEIYGIHFNSGVTNFFKSYAMDAQDLQTATVWELFVDEELPEHLQPELQMRLHATKGMWNAAFTATLGQELWRRTIEERGDRELFKGALKLQVSMYDCLKYEDGTPGPFTEKDIIVAMNSCKSEQEIQRRIFGKFIVEGGLKYPGFDPKKNIKKDHKLPKDWLIYVGIDIGSGGSKGHPSSIVFVAAAPDFKSGRVIKGWRGDGIETTAADVLVKYLEMKGEMLITGAYYDYQCRDFYTIATRNGIPVSPAEKSHDIGEHVVNVLFKNEMLYIYDHPDLYGLVTELRTLKKVTRKTDAADDFTDALRYATAPVPWDWSIISGETLIEPEPTKKSETDRRRDFALCETEEDLAWKQSEAEFDEWNELLEL